MTDSALDRARRAVLDGLRAIRHVNSDEAAIYALVEEEIARLEAAAREEGRIKQAEYCSEHLAAARLAGRLEQAEATCAALGPGTQPDIWSFAKEERDRLRQLEAAGEK